MNCALQRPPRSKLDSEIDRSLKRAFDAVASEPVPDRFAALLEKLGNLDRNHSDGAPNDA